MSYLGVAYQCGTTGVCFRETAYGAVEGTDAAGHLGRAWPSREHFRADGDAAACELAGCRRLDRGRSQLRFFEHTGAVPGDRSERERAVTM